MPKKNKDKKIIIPIIVLVLCLVLFFVVILLLKNQEAKKQEEVLSAEQEEIQKIIDANPYLQKDITLVNKQIKVEMATDEEMKEIGYGSTPFSDQDFRIQVIERGPNGEILSYRAVYTDEDILEEISVPEAGYFTEGGVIPFVED